MTTNHGFEMLSADMGELDEYRASMRATGRVQIKPVLSARAAECVLHAAEQVPFRLSVNSGAKSLDLALHELESLSQEQQAQMTALIHAGARSGFQYCFDTYRLSDEVESGRLRCGPLFDLYRDLNSARFLTLCRELSGEVGIDFCDAQVTRYRPGHFLTEHDDDVAHKGRVLAYVLNLTANWRPDWGGLLLFHGSDSAIEGGFAPVFNAINLFKVPRPHSVSLVAPFAGSCRYSVTGWARKRN